MNLDVNDLTAGEGEIADLWTNVQKVVIRHHVRWQTRELAGFVNVHRSLNTLALKTWKDLLKTIGVDLD